MPDFIAWLGHYGYAILFIVLAIEGFGVPGIPYEPLFIATGVLIGRGQMDLFTAIAVGAGGNLAGNVAGYIVGHWGLRRFVDDRAPSWLRVDPEQVERVRGWFSQYGGRTVVISRWFGPIRTPVIFGAGICGMGISRYVGFSAVASLSWVAAWQLAAWKFGYLAIRLWEHDRRWAFLLVAAVIAIWAVVHYRVVSGLRSPR